MFCLVSKILRNGQSHLLFVKRSAVFTTYFMPSLVFLYLYEIFFFLHSMDFLKIFLISRGVYFVRILKLFPPPSKVFPNFLIKVFRKNWKCSPLYDFYSFFYCFLPFYGLLLPFLLISIPFFKVILLFHCFNWSILKVFPKYLDHLKL